MNKVKISDFTVFPGLRYCSLSEKSGEAFYHSVLNSAFAEAYQKGEILEVDLDDTDGYASSFLDEAFGNLVYDFTLAVVKNYIQITSLLEPHWKKMLEEESFKEWEKRRLKAVAPSVTKDHQAWYRLEDNKLKKGVWQTPNKEINK